MHKKEKLLTKSGLQQYFLNKYAVLINYLIETTIPDTTMRE